MRVAGDSCDEAVGVGAPLSRICTAVGWKGECAAFSFGVPDLDRTVPGRRGEGGFGGEVPSAGESFAGVFRVCRNWEVGLQCGVEQTEGAVAAGCEKMRGM